jgi:nicotinamidase-related amidase
MARLLDAGDSVLIVVDTQPGFLRGVDDETAKVVEDRIRWLVRVAGFVGVPVVVTEEEPDRNGATSEAVVAVLPADQVRHRKASFGLAGEPAVMADLEASGPGHAHGQGLDRMHDAGAELVGTKGLAYEWLRTVDRASEMFAALERDTPMGIEL